MTTRIARFETQGPDETALFVLRAHPIVNLGWIVVGVFLVFLPLLVTVGVKTFWPDFPGPLKFSSLLAAILIWYLIVFGLMFQRFLLWFFNIYIVTNKRIVDIDFYNLFYKQISEAPLENIQDITHREVGILQNWFDFGLVVIQTAGERENFEFVDIADPDTVQRQLLDLVAAAKKSIFGQSGGLYGATGKPAESN